MRAKRYQLKSDRSYGLMFDEDATLAAVTYFNTPPPSKDPEMDTLVGLMGLQPVGDDSQQAPVESRQ